MLQVSDGVKICNNMNIARHALLLLLVAATYALPAQERKQAERARFKARIDKRKELLGPVVIDVRDPIDYWSDHYLLPTPPEVKNHQRWRSHLRLERNGDVFDTLEYNLFSYDSCGRVLSQEMYSLQKPQMQMLGNYKRICSYNTSGKVVEAIAYDYNQRTRAWNFGWKANYTYDDQRRETSRRFFNWIDSTRTWDSANWLAREYNDKGQEISIKKYYKNETDNQLFGFDYHTTAYDSTGRIREECWYNWDLNSGTWGSPREKKIYHYGSRGLDSLVTYSWNPLDKVWRPKMRDEYTYNKQGSITSRRFFECDFRREWVCQWRYKNWIDRDNIIYKTKYWNVILNTSRLMPTSRVRFRYGKHTRRMSRVSKTNTCELIPLWKKEHRDVHRFNDQNRVTKEKRYDSVCHGLLWKENGKGQSRYNRKQQLVSSREVYEKYLLLRAKGNKWEIKRNKDTNKEVVTSFKKEHFVWENNDLSIRDYTGEGWLKEEQSYTWNPEDRTWDLKDHRAYEYDNKGNKIRELSSFIDDTPYVRVEITYNKNNNKISEETFWWQSGQNRWTFASKTIIDYVDVCETGL